VTDALRTAGDYELFIYTIAERFPSIERSTLRFIRRGATLARVVGELYFAGDVRLTILQRVVYDRLPALIDAYGYEAWRGDEKLYWYDSQPHPGEPALQSSHPHHKHVPPELRHTRIPAPNLRFDRPNLPILIHEIEELLETLSGEQS
jgi:uncharacterized protein DUF6516